jgi:hypothetical protein
MLALGYLCSGTPDRLRPFALGPAFPTPDYYGRSDAPEVSPADCWPLRVTGASHVHDRGLGAVLSVAVSQRPKPLAAESRTPTR